jgi:hypothetical protein
MAIRADMGSAARGGNHFAAKRCSPFGNRTVSSRFYSGRVIKRSTIVRRPTAPRPSKIRREPPAPVAMPRKVNAYPTEQETRTVVIGVILFAIAFAIITIGLSDFTSR